MFERIRIGFFTLKKPDPIRQARKNDPACFFYDLGHTGNKNDLPLIVALSGSLSMYGLTVPALDLDYTGYACLHLPFSHSLFCFFMYIKSKGPLPFLVSGKMPSKGLSPL